MKRRGSLLLVLMAMVLLAAVAANARVGGGSSYSGGGSSSGGGSGGDGDGSLDLLFRFLFWLTIEHPAIGIPVDILLVVGFLRAKRSGVRPSFFASAKNEGLTPVGGLSGGLSQCIHHL